MNSLGSDIWNIVLSYLPLGKWDNTMMCVDKVVISNITIRKKLQEMKDESCYRYFTYEDALKAVQKDGYKLKYVHTQTTELCRVAVQQAGLALKYVHVQTPELCRLAVQEDGNAIYYVNL